MRSVDDGSIHGTFDGDSTADGGTGEAAQPATRYRTPYLTMLQDVALISQATGSRNPTPRKPGRERDSSAESRQEVAPQLRMHEPYYHDGVTFVERADPGLWSAMDRSTAAHLSLEVRASGLSGAHHGDSAADWEKALFLPSGVGVGTRSPRKRV